MDALDRNSSVFSTSRLFVCGGSEFKMPDSCFELIPEQQEPLSSPARLFYRVQQRSSMPAGSAGAISRRNFKAKLASQGTDTLNTNRKLCILVMQREGRSALLNCVSYFKGKSASSNNLETRSVENTV